MSFPRPRLIAAGASESEVTALEVEFDRLSPELQAAQAQRWASVATGDLTQWLDSRREQNPPVGTEAQSEPALDPSPPVESAGPTEPAPAGPPPPPAAA